MTMMLIMFMFISFIPMLVTGEFFLVGGFVVLLYYLVFQFPLEEGFRYLYSFLIYDSLSLSLIILVVYLTLLMWFSSYSVKKSMYNFFVYLYLMILLCLILWITFMSLNYLIFYFFFESSLIPTLLIILGWGYQPERLQAGVYFMLYTLLASLPLLMNIYFIYSMAGTMWMHNYIIGVWGLMKFYVENSLFTYIFTVFLVMAFLVKLPMFMFHLWLPKAHVEAPVAGSMILAGVLLKLGGYGLCRVASMFYFYSKWLGHYVIGLSIAGMVFIGINCCRLNDMKAMVAYSSVAHMALVIGGIFSYFTWGLSGGLMLMLSHGLVSSGLFCMVNMFYDRLSSRSLWLNKGLISVFPGFCLMFFMLCCFNIAAPPSINLLSEIFLMVSILSYDVGMMLLFPLGSFLGAVFTFYLFSYSQHGKLYMIMWGFKVPLWVEFHLCLLHLVPVVLLILNSGLFLTYL